MREGTKVKRRNHKTTAKLKKIWNRKARHAMKNGSININSEYNKVRDLYYVMN